MIINIRKHFDHDRYDEYMKQYVYEIHDSDAEKACECAAGAVSKYEQEYLDGEIDDDVLLQDYVESAFRDSGITFERKEIKILDCYLF
ncbi:MAG: hypothetical protein IJI57_12800 [Flexilinea sp.]|nr:hypothetical protein [Flexilinea sp.]